MARFDLYALPAGAGYIVDVQSDHASEHVRTRVVAPLLPVEELGRPIAKLNPTLRLGARDYALVVQSLATLTQAEMGNRIGSLADEYGDRFSYALDILFTGF